MYPELLHLGPVTIYSFGVMAALALISAALVSWLVLRGRGVPFDFAFELLFAAGIGGFVGARIYYLLQHWSEVRGDFWGSAFGGAGFTWYGGLLGGFVAVLLVARRRRTPAGTVANIMAPPIALGYAVARIGCFLSGDGTYGRPSGLPWAMAFPHGTVPTSVPVQPTTLYETATMLVVFAVLYRLASRPQPGWYVFGWFLVLSGAERFLIEFLRINPRWLLGLTPPQWFALAGILVGSTIVVRLRARDDRLSATA